ncbi:MAG: redox protein, regulator of disulfide bond formation [Chloroflexi bacterium CSP1-4]|nr:MAG: redox protein, regulator of disulfide bond formation [Chloroflexi bacterium CSP1-4]
MMATITVRNGVNVDQLVATIGAIQADPAVAAFTFKARSTWEDGGRSRGEIRDFVHAGSTSDRGTTFPLVGDEPPVLLGSNAGPNAVELLLQALAFCYGVGYAYNAAARGIEISELRYEVEGDIDLRTFVGLQGPRAGFTAIRAKSWVKSPNATPAELEELCQYVQDTSPVRDCLANPIPVTTDLVVLD